MLRAVFVALVVVVVTLLMTGALAETVCLRGAVDLTTSASAPNATYCNETSCGVQWELSFDAAAVNSQSWPLTLIFDNDGSELADLFPALSNVTFHCDGAGDITANTAFGNNSEHLRLLWTYTGANSFDCSYVLANIDWTTDFTQFQLLLSYGGDIATFDATYSSTLENATSLDALTVECPETPVETTTTTDTTTDTTTYSTTAAINTEFGDCRFPLSVWISTRLHAAEWLSVADLDVCGISYVDLARERNSATDLADGFLLLAQAVVETTLNGRMYSLSDDAIADQLAAFAQALVITGNPTNCASTLSYDAIIIPLNEFNNASSACAGAPVSGQTHNDSCTDKKQKAYLTWAIVMTCVAGALLIALGVLVVLLIFRTNAVRTMFAGDEIEIDDNGAFASLTVAPQPQSQQPVATRRPVRAVAQPEPVFYTAADIDITGCRG